MFKIVLVVICIHLLVCLISSLLRDYIVEGGLLDSFYTIKNVYIESALEFINNEKEFNRVSLYPLVNIVILFNMLKLYRALKKHSKEV